MNRSRWNIRRTKTESKPEKKERNYIASAITSGIFLLLINAFWPDLIPISSRQVWTVHGTAAEWLSLSWPIFVWGVGATFVLSLFKQMGYRERQVHAGHKFVGGLLISVWAGLVEEVCFRWLIFLPAVVSALIGNWFFGGIPLLIFIALFGGILGIAVTQNGLGAILGVVLPAIVYLVCGGLPPAFPEWFHLNVWGPLADYTTGGYLHDTIFHPTGFAVGSAMLYANAFFRDGHKYQGLIGVLNSWFLGMFFFYLMLTYGLPAAILVHFAYDAVVFSTSALVHSWRNDL